MTSLEKPEPLGDLPRACEPPDAAEARHEKVGAAAHGHERFEGRDAAARGGAGELELAAAALRDDRIGAVVLVGELGIVDPRLLHELELPADVGVEANEMKSAFGLRLGTDGVEAPQE